MNGYSISSTMLGRICWPWSNIICAPVVSSLLFEVAVLDIELCAISQTHGLYLIISTSSLVNYRYGSVSSTVIGQIHAEFKVYQFLRLIDCWWLGIFSPSHLITGLCCINCCGAVPLVEIVISRDVTRLTKCDFVAPNLMVVPSSL